MAIIFNGTGPKACEGFEGYCHGRQWDDPGLLRFSPSPQSLALRNHNTWLHSFNTEATIKDMLENVPKASKGHLQHNTVREWVDAAIESASVIVLKGLHQWELGFTQAHISIGYEGYLWHLYAVRRGQTMMLCGGITRGDYQAPQTHDGWAIVKKKS